MDDHPVIKRRRVGLACDRCRAMKSKCDGCQPRCGRCCGYGYTCTWTGGRRRAWKAANDAMSLSSSTASTVPSAFHNTLKAYDSLFFTMREKLAEGERIVLDERLKCIRESVEDDPIRPSASPSHSDSSLPPLTAGNANNQPSPCERYLGQVSDVSFFNSVKSLIRSTSNQEFGPEKIDSYEIDVSGALESSPPVMPDLPSREDSDNFVHTYFSTIHEAYPFICKQAFLQEYEKFWAANRTDKFPCEWLATLLTMFAIGSHYKLVSSHETLTSTDHARYFSQAVTISRRIGSERSSANVCLLLMQCFYLLASCQTDRCWTTLGLAIRIGQSIGIHAEDDEASMSLNYSAVEREMRRRAWYSLYVLDCLLSLQLGRPLAIVLEETTVDLPSPVDDMHFDLSAGNVPVSADGPQSGDYFRSVIQFSHIVGRAVRQLSGPRRERYGEIQLQNVETLDGDLLRWRARLPRSLRFDLGHTFERTEFLRKQRNMLAIKFFHLRTLIHRPHLCALWLQPMDALHPSLNNHDRHRIQISEMICVESAQETARLMHHVSDKKSLVEDYPWWQLISCMICASSVMLVASKFSAILDLMDDTQRLILDENIGTFLTVFDALSVNSQAARLARDMTRGLQSAKRQGISLTAAPVPTFTTDMPVTNHDGENNPSKPEAALSVPLQSNPGDQIQPQWLDSSNSVVPGAEGMSEVWQQQWPFEFSDSLIWSSKFVDLNNLSDAIEPRG